MKRGLVLMLLILSATVVPAPAAAATDGELRCSTIDKWVWQLSVGFVNDDQCDPVKISGDVNDLRNASDNQTKADIHAAALSQRSQTEVARAVDSNYVQDLEPRIWMKVEATIAEEYENGSTAAQAITAANETIEDAVSRRQINTLERVNASLMTWKYLRTRAKNESGISKNYVTWLKEDGSMDPDYYTSDSDTHYEGLVVRNVTLANGTTHATYWLHAQNTYSGTTDYYENPIGDGNGVNWGGMVVQAPTSGTERVTIYNRMAEIANWKAHQNMSARLKADVPAFTNAAYSGFENSTMNTSDILSAVTVKYEYGTNGTQMSNFIGALAQQGFDTPNASRTGVMEVTAGYDRYLGMVFARHAPNGTWKTDTTYNGSEIDGPVFVATVEGDVVQLDGEFQITAMEDRNGTDITQVNTTEYNYQTANTTELLERIETLENLVMEMEEREKEAASGGGDSDDSGGDWFDWGTLSNLQTLVVIAAGAVTLIGAVTAAISFTTPGRMLR